ncbi:hypothetical protein UFOVP685_8 [uncultured Caudovirales phage]|uniref:Uncharacterized protein n=1 Tax=uncultured Caudovirales phage TaxID=2100421 RepID=A0A6J5NEH4_9CAUD|nr:hypothetical protein UFOVP590_15 [uncultured Caudovirales phage]CAB4157187.1 hypothetical protein UFOVP685_8 [uncultured Caudovirales phage]CAB5225538.1 hypothetical protein UFOVP750_44 [uncultured Caudovirales phage]
MFTAITIIAVLYVVFHPQIKSYRYSKKSPEQKYRDYRKFVNDWNGTNYR